MIKNIFNILKDFFIGVISPKWYESKTILKFTGLFLFIIYIWFRFVRERLPKDIPFDLTLLRFVSLLGICLTFSLIIYNLITDSRNVNPYLEKALINREKQKKQSEDKKQT